MRDALGQVSTVLVLGGTSEIARHTVQALVGRGLEKAVLAVREPDRAERDLVELRSLGLIVEVVLFDADCDQSVLEGVDEAFHLHGDFDLVFLAFGVLGDQRSLERDPAAAARLVRTNLAGAVVAGLAVAQRLRAQGHGTLVVLSSVAGQRSRRSNFVYGATKAGLDAFAQGLDDSLVGSGADVLVVRPGFVRTRMTAGLDPQPFAVEPEAVATAIVEALRRRRRVVWVPAALRWVFALIRVLPRPLWRLVSSR
jgi:decaprenylphospho-beta-D-erythro-pentofuranosid-2-ulose 2-reductase